MFSAPGGGTGPGTCTPGWARHNRSASRDRARSFPRERGNAPRPPRRAPPPSGMSHPWKRSRARGAAGATRDSAPRHGRNVPAREARTGRTGPGAPPGSSRARPRSQRMFPGARRSRRSLRSHTCVSQGRQTRRGRLGSAPDPKPPQSSHRGSLRSREEPPPAPGRWDCGNLVSPLGVAAAGSVGDRGPQRGPSGRSCRAGGTTRVPFMDEVAMGDGRGLHPDRDPREPFQGPSVTPLGQEPRGPGRGRVPAGPARRWWERGETQTFRREEPAESRTLPRRQH